PAVRTHLQRPAYGVDRAVRAHRQGDDLPAVGLGQRDRRLDGVLVDLTQDVVLTTHGAPVGIERAGRLDIGHVLDANDDPHGSRLPLGPAEPLTLYLGARAPRSAVCGAP